MPFTLSVAMKKILLPSILATFILPAMAQDTARKRTIDITSSFKPVLRTPDKIAFAASPAPTDTNRRVQPYAPIVQSLALMYLPSPLRPLAFENDSMVKANNVFLKAGFGNFSTPYLKGAAGFGAGKPLNGSVYGDLLASKGKLDHQQFSRFRGGADLYAQAGANHLAEAGLQLTGIKTYRYGYGEKNVVPDADSLRLPRAVPTTTRGRHLARRAHSSARPANVRAPISVRPISGLVCPSLDEMWNRPKKFFGGAAGARGSAGQSGPVNTTDNRPWACS